MDIPYVRIKRGVLDGKLLELMNGQDTYVCFLDTEGGFPATNRGRQRLPTGEMASDKPRSRRVHGHGWVGCIQRC